MGGGDDPFVTFFIPFLVLSFDRASVCFVFGSGLYPLNLVQSSPFDLKNDVQDRAHLLKATCVF